MDGLSQRRGMQLVAAFVLVTSVTAFLSPRFSSAAPATCGPRVATITGTAGDDVLFGTPRRDFIAGGAGDDRIYGRAGNDRICGGPGKDLLTGGGSEGTEPWERLMGGRGRDTVFFPKRVTSAGVSLRVRGPKRGGVYKAHNYGAARLVSIENARGTRSGDLLRGDSKPNKLWGRGGDDVLRGRKDDDRLVGRGGHDEVYGGPGRDDCPRAERTTHCE